MKEREYITTERANLFDVNMTIAMKVVVQGAATEQQVVDAFKMAVAAHEILNTKIVLDPNGYAYYEPVEKNKNTICFCDKDISDIISEQEKIRFKLEEGELLRAFVQQNEDGFTFNFLMHHLGGDGKSLCYFIESFLRGLNGEELEVVPMGRLDVENMPKDSRLPIMGKMYLKQFNNSWKKETSLFNQQDLIDSFKRFWKDHKTTTTFKVVDEVRLQELKDKCHNLEIGLTSCLIADLIKKKETKQDIGIAVDGRLDGNRSMGNQATGVSIQHKYDSKLSVYDNAKKLDEKLKEKLSKPSGKYFILHFMAGLAPSLVDALSLEFTGAFKSNTSRKLADLLGYGEKKKDLSITNLTVLDIPATYGDFKIKDFWFVPPVISNAQNVVGIVTVNDRMYMTTHKYV